MFIALEGNEASGKSTIIKEIKKYYNKKKISCFITREPGGTKCETSEKIRKMLVNQKLETKTELLLYMLSRNEHLVKIISKKQKKNDLVITDRFYYSSVVYQGYLRKLGMDRVLKINELLFNKFIPDLIIVLLVKPEISISRIRKRKNSNYYDKMDLEKHKLIYKGYKKIINNKKNIYYINGDDKQENILKKILKLINDYSKKF